MCIIHMKYDNQGTGIVLYSRLSIQGTGWDISICPLDRGVLNSESFTITSPRLWISHNCTYVRSWGIFNVRWTEYRESAIGRLLMYN